ncbi:MAG: hypothetical protein BWY19_01139 [bacterium ADurb.Bin212]|nr:MAG: hypothetical protein BWY19_01139 [bacterium ADurb.Bin212]
MNKKLDKILDNKTLGELSEDILNHINKLPYTHDFIFPLFQVKDFNECEINSNISIFSISQSDIDNYNKDDGLLSAYIGNYDPKENDLVVKIKRKGYYSDLCRNSIEGDDPLFMFKIIVAIYYIRGIFERSNNIYSQVMSHSGSYTYIAHASEVQNVEYITATHNDKKFLFNLQLGKEALTINPFIKQSKIEIANDLISKLDDSSRDPEFKNKIKNSCYWLFETIKTPEDHLRTVFLTSTLDSLIGDQHESDVVAKQRELVVSTSIAKNYEEYKKIRTSIKQLYDERNKIIHGKVSIFETYNSSRIRSDIDQALWYVMRFINKQTIMIDR